MKTSNKMKHGDIKFMNEWYYCIIYECVIMHNSNMFSILKVVIVIMQISMVQGESWFYALDNHIILPVYLSCWGVMLRSCVPQTEHVSLKSWLVEVSTRWSLDSLKSWLAEVLTCWSLDSMSLNSPNYWLAESDTQGRDSSAIGIKNTGLRYMLKRYNKGKGPQFYHPCPNWDVFGNFMKKDFFFRHV